jgi:predicted  nucleic acid-binding Zn-ribbon protein
MLENFLEYQNTDAELLKIQKQIAGNENKKQANYMIKYVKDASSKTGDLNHEAGRLLKEFERIEEVKEKGISLVDKYSKQDLSDLKPEEMHDLENRIKKASANLKELEKKLLGQANKINTVLTEFETTKKKVMIARQKHKQNKDAYDNFIKEVTPKVRELQGTLKEKEKGLDKELFEKYKNLRKDNIFPIVVSLNNNACGGCRTYLPSTTLERIKDKGYIECEQCRRIIYSK